MQFGQFRFATLHKQYLIFTGPVPTSCADRYGSGYTHFLAYSYYEDRGLSCILLATVVFQNETLSIVTDTPEKTPVIISPDELRERTCIPLRRGIFDLSRYAYAEQLAEQRDPSPISNKPVFLSRLCGVCKHHRGRSGWKTCDAFPGGIPPELWNAETDPQLPCSAGIRFSPKEPRLFLEVFDTSSGRVVYRYEADGDPINPDAVRKSSDLGASILTTFREMMQDWHAKTSEPTKQLLHCARSDGAFIAGTCSNQRGDDHQPSGRPGVLPDCGRVPRVPHVKNKKNYGTRVAAIRDL